MLLLYSAVEDSQVSRRVGMADEADSKSVVGNHVRVQVPLPAVKTCRRNLASLFYIKSNYQNKNIRYSNYCRIREIK